MVHCPLARLCLKERVTNLPYRQKKYFTCDVTQWYGPSCENYQNYRNEKGRPGGLSLEPDGGVEGTNEKGKLWGDFCVRMLVGGGPQSNVAGAGEGELSPSGFLVDQADLAWCFALRFPPLELRVEGDVEGGNVTGSGGREVIVALSAG